MNRRFLKLRKFIKPNFEKYEKNCFRDHHRREVHDTVYQSKGIFKGEKNLETIFLERRSSSISGRYGVFQNTVKVSIWVKMDLWVSKMTDSCRENYVIWRSFRLNRHHQTGSMNDGEGVHEKYWRHDYNNLFSVTGQFVAAYIRLANVASGTISLTTTIIGIRTFLNSLGLW